MEKQEGAVAFSWHRLISMIGRNRLEIAAITLLGSPLSAPHIVPISPRAGTACRSKT
jgi:hypothetical protein